MDGSQKEEVTLISFRKKGVVPRKGGRGFPQKRGASNPGGNYDYKTEADVAQNLIDDFLFNFDFQRIFP